MISKHETLADDVLDAHEIEQAPVDVFGIATRENISLCPVTKCSSDFWGRIEYHTEVNRFLLYYPDNLDAAETRVRFSIAHELGHFFIPEHREVLMSGKTHNSQPGFICDEPMEREADAFAAALLIPSILLKKKMARDSLLTLEQVLAVAKECNASRECSAIRYTKFTEEPCVVVISENGVVKYGISSDEAHAMGYWISKGSKIPTCSATSSAESTTNISEKKFCSKTWFPASFREIDMWEESVSLGYGGLILTLLSWDAVD